MPAVQLQTNPLLSVFNIRNKSPLDIKMFLDESGTVDISRSDIVKYAYFERLADTMREAMWRHEEINLARDKIDFYSTLSDAEQFIFTANIKRQTVLDTTQSLGLPEAILPLVSDPMIKRNINFITYFEEIHNMTYEYIIKNVYNDPTEVMDGIRDIELIVSMGKTVGRYYDELILETAKYRLGQTTLYQLKKKLWMCLHSINALEGIRFAVSFACSFSFGNSKRMIGNSSEIKLIANDELFHVAFTTKLLRELPKDDHDFIQIRDECRQAASELFMEVVADEKRWSKYLFQHGSTIGLNEVILNQYVDFLASNRMKAVYLDFQGDVPKSNPLPWISKWLNEGEMQGANQETENTSYVMAVANDLKKDSFKGIEL